MNLRKIIAVLGIFSLSTSAVVAEDVEMNTKITIPSLNRSTSPITMSTDSRFIKELIGKRKTSRSADARRSSVMEMSNTVDKNSALLKGKNKKAKSEVIQLKLTEQAQKVVNTSKSFVFFDVTRRDKDTAAPVEGMTKRKQIIESLRQAAVKR